MAGKSQKKPSQLDQIQTSLSRLDKRVEGLDKRVTDLARELSSSKQESTQEFKSVRQEMADGLESVRQEMADGLQSVRQEMADGLQSVRQEMADGLQSVRQEMAEGFERQGNALQKQIHTLADQIAENEKKEAQFRDSMLTAVDAVMKNYELFRQEKVALGAGQDRLQQEVDQLMASGQQQNEALRGLDERVTRLEAA